MTIGRKDDVLAQLLYHRDRIKQEDRLARAARCPRVAGLHAELRRLHEIRRDGLFAAE